MSTDKSLGIAASFAKLLGCFPAFKSVDDINGTVGIKYLFDILIEDIAEVDDTVAVKTAGNDGSVRKDPELVFKTVAEKFIVLNFCIKVGPFKALAPFEKYFITNCTM